MWVIVAGALGAIVGDSTLFLLLMAGFYFAERRRRKRAIAPANPAVTAA